MDVEKDLVIGIDASTTGCKAIIWTHQGEQIASGRCEINQLNPKIDWHEQSALDWWQALRKATSMAIADIDSGRIAGVCICPQRETFVPVNDRGRPLRNAISWMDNRARSLLPKIESLVPSFHKITGKPLSGNLTVLKILWLKENEPDVFVQTNKFLDVAAYLNFLLTGNYATGRGIADPTGLFDMRQDCWADEILRMLNVRASNFPIPNLAGTVIGKVSRTASQECNLPDDVLVIAGVGDGQAGGLGCNITKPGECYLSLGTSVVMGIYADTYVTDIAFRTMYAGIPDGYSLETVILGGTYTIDWFMNNFSGGYAISHFDKEIQNLPPGPGDLILVPYWNGVLAPYWDSTASGIILGWRGHHDAVHLYRAILEGIGYELRLHLEGAEAALSQSINRVVVLGGGSKNNIWCQIIADITGKEICTVDVAEATSLGAGILAAYGTGIFDSIKDAACNMSARIQTSFLPDHQRHHHYSRLYKDVYRDLFPNLQSLSKHLAREIDLW
jgi:sugar (pentulose or hexulose) kinase